MANVNNIMADDKAIQDNGRQKECSIAAGPWEEAIGVWGTAANFFKVPLNSKTIFCRKKSQ